MRISFLLLILLVVCASLSFAITRQAKTFSMKDPKGVSAILFTLDSVYEPLSGFTTGIDGTVSFDSTDVSKTRGEVVVQTASLRMLHDRMNEYLHSERWLNSERFPEIRFRFEGLKNVKQQVASVEAVQAGTAGVWSADADGELTLHGVTKRVTVPVTVSWFPNKLQARVANMQGDLIVVRSDFSIRRSDFGIEGGLPTTILSDRIDLQVRIVGVAPQTGSTTQFVSLGEVVN